jgi:ATP-dependent 26S proteasome regulatory subunit
MFAIRDGREQVEQDDFECAVAKVLPPTRMPEASEFALKPEKMYGY